MTADNDSLYNSFSILSMPALFVRVIECTNPFLFFTGRAPYSYSCVPAPDVTPFLFRATGDGTSRDRLPENSESPVPGAAVHQTGGGRACQDLESTQRVPANAKVFFPHGDALHCTHCLVTAAHQVLLRAHHGRRRRRHCSRASIVVGLI